MNKKAILAGRIISTLISLPFLMSAFMKLRATPEVIEGTAKMGISPNLLTPLGILEATCVIIYAIPKTAVLGAILLTGYMGGAILTHLRVGEAPTMQVIFGIVIWLGIFLRDARLRDLIPLRK